MCVRYRYDEERRKRIKTVELVEEESSWVPAAAIYLVKIGSVPTQQLSRPGFGPAAELP